MPVPGVQLTVTSELSVASAFRSVTADGSVEIESGNMYIISSFNSINCISHGYHSNKSSHQSGNYFNKIKISYVSSVNLIFCVYMQY